MAGVTPRKAESVSQNDVHETSHTLEKRRFPQPSSIQQHAITEDEVIQLVESVLASLRACAPSEQVL
eukprot:scaffold94856_cov39-Phaeocystis_antarctica.AAC.2